MDERQLMKELGECELSPVGRLLFELVRNQFRIINRLDTIVDQNEKLMADITALNAEITQLITDETANFSTVISEITTFLSTQPGAVDFTPQITQLQALDADITGLPAKVQAALTPAATTPPASGAGASSPAPSTGTATANVARKTV